MPDRDAGFIDIPEALAELKAGKMIVLIDDEDRENEGDLTIAAEFCTPEAINFMARYGRGLICLTLTEERADYMRLGPMTQDNTSRFGTAFTETIEAREGVTTGISAADRAHTIQVAISPNSSPHDLARPGHVFPLRARKGGVLVRAGQTEASVDLARMAGLIPAGVICEIMNEDGSMARVPDLIEFCKPHDLKMVTVADLIRYRMANERYIHRIAEGVLPTEYGDFRMFSYESDIQTVEHDLGAGNESHVALTFGDLAAADKADTPVLVRVHTHCLAGNVFGSTACDCRATVDAASARSPAPASAPSSTSTTPSAASPSTAPRIPRGSASTARPRRGARAPRRPRPAHPPPGRPRRPDHLRPRHPQDPPAHQPPQARPRPAGLRHRDRGARPHRSLRARLDVQ